MGKPYIKFYTIIRYQNMGSCLSRSKKEKSVDDHKVKEDAEKKAENEIVVNKEEIAENAKNDVKKSLPKTDLKNAETDAEQAEKNGDNKAQSQDVNAKEN